MRDVFPASGISARRRRIEGPLGSVGQILQSDGVKTIYVDPSFGRNVIINGNFDVWQRGTIFTSVASGTYTADRWLWGEVGAGVVDVLQSTNVPDNTSDFSFLIDVTTVDASIAAGDNYAIAYRVEGYDAMQFGFGTADAQSLTLSFWVRSSVTGTNCVAFRNSALDRNFIVEYTINAIDTWEYKTITITADTTGTWLTDSGIGLNISWALAVGSTFQGTVGTWQAGNLIATSTQVNAMNNAANAFLLSRVQLEIGTVASAFKRRSLAQELALAQRYYFKTFAFGTAPAQNVGRAGVGTANGDDQGDFRIQIQYPVTMRASPATTLYNPSAANASVRNQNDSTDTAGTTSPISSERIATVAANPLDATDANDTMEIHISADAEL